MYIWSTGKLTQELKANTTSMVSKLLYLSVIVLQYTFGFLIFQAVPTVYRFLFTYAKEHLEARTGHPSLTVTVYNQVPEWFPWALGVVTVAGLIGCIVAHYPSKPHSFIDRWVCLNTPISVRILFVGILFFCIPVVFGGLYFANQLLELQQTITQSAAYSNPLSFIWSIFTKATGIKVILNGLALLDGAQQIFKDINQFSFHAHLASYWIALTSTALYFWQLQKRMRCINAKP